MRLPSVRLHNALVVFKSSWDGARTISAVLVQTWALGHWLGSLVECLAAGSEAGGRGPRPLGRAVEPRLTSKFRDKVGSVGS